jgi:enediyne biosynthesis protein E4
VASSRRNRRVRIALALAALFVLVVVAVLLGRGGDSTYRPGGEVDGLTSDLDRELGQETPGRRFVDVTEQAGISFQHLPGGRSSQLPEDMGSGVAWGDYDADGDPDLFLANLAGPLPTAEQPAPPSAGRAALYRNNGDGTFTERGAEAGVDHAGMGMGAAWADYDGDGALDLVVTAYGGISLYRNRGDGTFEQRAKAAGMGDHLGFWAGPSWADYDRDGHVDLHVAGYVRYDPALVAGGSSYDTELPVSLNPSTFPAERNLLFRNLGDGTFEETAAVAGVLGDLGRSLEGLWADVDDDGWLDLYVANDVSDNALYLNRGDGTFEDVGHAAHVADYRGAMGIAAGDWDGDSDLDLFVTHWVAQENALYQSRRTEDPEGAHLRFQDEADRFGLGQVALDYIGWATSFFDFDNDGLLDLYVVNGSTLQRRDDRSLLVPMRDLLFWNRGTAEGFFDLGAAAGPWFEGEAVGRGGALADYDRDGDLDLVVLNHGGSAVLLRNDGEGGHWLELQLTASGGNTAALGATVLVTAGGRTHRRAVGGQSSYLSQNEAVLHVGLGEAEYVELLEVRWPDGELQRVRGMGVDRLVVIKQGEELAAQPPVLDERERVTRFWAALREATRLRVAGKLEAAAASYREALRYDPAHEDALYYLGNVQLALGDAAGARASWTELVRIAPRSGRTHQRLGDLSLCLQRPGLVDLVEAEDRFSRAQQINLEETGPLVRLGEVALLRGDRALARERLEAATASNPKAALAWLLLGWMAEEEGDQERAVELFGKAVEAVEVAAPSAQPAGEGDTRAGGAMLAGQTTCRGLGAAAAALREGSAKSEVFSLIDGMVDQI